MTVDKRGIGEWPRLIGLMRQLCGHFAQRHENATLRHVLEMLNERIVQVRVVTSPARFRHAVAEHLEIIAALKGGDALEAMNAMRRHLESARQSLVLLA